LYRYSAVVGNGGVNLNDPHQGRAIDSAVGLGTTLHSTFIYAVKTRFN
jgi:hypothetical protein